jgi:hypothetical protein
MKRTHQKTRTLHNTGWSKMYLPSLMLYSPKQWGIKISFKYHWNQNLKPFILRCVQCVCPRTFWILVSVLAVEGPPFWEQSSKTDPVSQNFLTRFEIVCLSGPTLTPNFNWIALLNFSGLSDDRMYSSMINIRCSILYKIEWKQIINKWLQYYCVSAKFLQIIIIRCGETEFKLGWCILDHPVSSFSAYVPLCVCDLVCVHVPALKFESTDRVLQHFVSILRHWWQPLPHS